MSGVTRLTDPTRPSSRAFNLALIFILLLSLTGFQLSAPQPTAADPALSVSTSVTKPLLGGTATVNITVTNTGPDKGYNLSLDAVVSSSIAPAGSFAIANPTVPATTQLLDSVSGETSLTFVDLVDLAPTESYTLSFEVDISGDPAWEVGDLLLVSSAARVNTIPDSSGTWIAGSDSAQAEVIPIDLVHKSANQSTSVQQVSGTEDRTYTYTIEIQNNFANPSRSVVVTDTLPDGVEFLGTASGPALDAGFGVADLATGETDLQWTLGDLAPGQSATIVYDTGVRYDYYGTGQRR